MSWSKKDPPAHVIKAYEDGLMKFIDPADRLWRVFSEAYPGQHKVHEVKHEAHEVFSLGLRDIWRGDKPIDGTETGKACSVGWRFVAADEALAGACHVSESPDRVTAKLTGLSRASNLATVFDLIEAFEEMQEVKARKNEEEVEYDRVVLRIPGLVEAFWLKSEERPEKDLVVPFYTRIKDKDYKSIVNRPLSVKEFLEIIQPIASKRLEVQSEEG